VPKYKDTYKRDGINFSVTRRQGNICLLTGSHNHTPELHTYEVHKLRLRNAHPMSAEAGELILSRPADSEWGKFGWTFTTLEGAQRKFNEMVKHAEQEGHLKPACLLSKAS